MSNFVTVTYEGKDSIQEIQKKFKDNLKEKEILKTTARAINETAKKVQGFIRQGVRKEYTIKNKYLMKSSYVSKMASGVGNRLYAHVKFSYRPVPMIAFKHTGTSKIERPITVTIKRGKSIRLRHAWIGIKRRAKKDIPEREAIFSFGRYIGKRFVPDLNAKKGDWKNKAGELMTSSPYAMSMNKNMQPKINEYVSRELPVKLQVFLQQKIDKMKRTPVA